MTNSNSNRSDFSALVDFSKIINSSLDVEFTLNNLLLTCMGKLLVPKGLIYLLNEENEFELRLQKGIKKGEEIPALKFSFQDYTNEKKREVIFNKKIFPVTVELKGTQGLTGLMLLGQKFNGIPFTPEDKRFLSTIANISATAIENAKEFSLRKKLNKELNSKVNQLTTLFELSKEFSTTIDIQDISRVLILSLIGQLMVAEFAVLLFGKKNFQILKSKFDSKRLSEIFEGIENFELFKHIDAQNFAEHFPKLAELGVRLIIPMTTKEEIKGLILLGKRKNEQPYSKSDVEFASSLASIATISIENARMIEQVIEKQKMEKELETARAIQKSLLPASLPKLENFDIAGTSESARQVGGDYYDVIKLNDDETLIAIGDVSGKGVQASLLMANLQAFLKSISKQNIPLVEATALINDLVSENTRMGNFITFFWGILNDKTGEFEYVNAGHNPPILIHNEDVSFLKTGGMLLGVTKTLAPYKSEKVLLPKGSRLILYTDGITETLDEHFNEYGLERLVNLVKESDGSSEELLEKILNNVYEFSKGKEQYDDITCVIVSSKENR